MSTGASTGGQASQGAPPVAAQAAAELSSGSEELLPDVPATTEEVREV